VSTATEQPPLDLLVLLTKRWRTISILGALGVAAALTYGFLAPKWYSATLTVVPSQRSGDAGGLAAKLPGLAGLDPTSLADVQRIHSVLTSNSVADEVIEKFNLKARYEQDHLEHARKALWEHCSTSVDRKSSVVSLSCEDMEPQRAQAMAAYFGEVGNRVFGRISASSAREERKFLETQVLESRKAVDEASRKLREFQENHKVVDLTEQSKATISAMASIQGDLLSKQLELSYLSSFSSRTESSVVQLRQQIGIMEAKLKDLESSTPVVAQGSTPPPASNATARDADFFPDAMSVPELRFQLEQLFREQKIQETVFFLMTQRYEMAKVDEARDTSTFQILDHPTLPTYKFRPRRARIAALGLAGGLALAGLWIVVPVWWRRRTGRGE
jgi:capsule polysaccharide export protein KpsE/RkpR